METTTLRAIGSRAPQRAEFRRSARNAAEYEAMGHMFMDLYPDVPLPKRLWDWTETAQYALAEKGALGAAGPLDLMICATAVHHGLVVLHDDGRELGDSGVAGSNSMKIAAGQFTGVTFPT